MATETQSHVADEQRPAKEKRKWVKPSLPPRPQPPKIPRAASIIALDPRTKLAEAGPLPKTALPPQGLVARIGMPTIAVGFDIASWPHMWPPVLLVWVLGVGARVALPSAVKETHSWPEQASKKGHIGQFGWYTMKDDDTLGFARIIQLGWAIGDARGDAAVNTKAYLVSPDGFEVAAKATSFHKLSHERVAREGRALTDVLCEFMLDVKAACACGGRVVAHQLEFDAGVIWQDELPTITQPQTFSEES